MTEQFESTYAVAIYSTGRAYGGPEEGGWWYAYGDLQGVASWQYAQDRAYEAARAFNEAQRDADPRWSRDGGLEARVIAIPRTEPDPAAYPCHDEEYDEVTRWDIPTSFPERAPHFC